MSGNTRTRTAMGRRRSLRASFACTAAPTPAFAGTPWFVDMMIGVSLAGVQPVNVTLVFGSVLFQDTFFRTSLFRLGGVPGGLSHVEQPPRPGLFGNACRRGATFAAAAPGCPLQLKVIPPFEIVIYDSFPSPRSP